MKKIFYFIIVILFPVYLSAQVEVELTIENQTVVGTDFFFDIFLKKTATSTGDLFLGNADFVLTFNRANFSSPTLTLDGVSPGGCTFVPTDKAGLNPSFTQDAYFNATATTLNMNELIINVNGPTPANQSVFDTRVAKIDAQSSTHRLGRFKLSGISNAAGTAGLAWKTTGGGVVTQVFTLANTPDFMGSAATLVATNPTNVTLPVELIQFTAASSEKAIQLEWESASEQAFLGYEVERSIDGKNFAKIAWLVGKGNEAKGAAYQYKDEAVKQNIIYYYRLKMLDLDGTFEYSPMRVASINDKSSVVRIYPNPVVNEMVVEWESKEATNTMLNLYNATGQKVMSKSLLPQDGFQKMVLDRSNLPSGVYFLHIQSNSSSYTQSVILKD
jgi:hypothetical protein